MLLKSHYFAAIEAAVSWLPVINIISPASWHSYCLLAFFSRHAAYPLMALVKLQRYLREAMFFGAIMSRAAALRFRYEARRYMLPR
jgi:hypothetical protein